MDEDLIKGAPRSLPLMTIKNNPYRRGRPQRMAGEEKEGTVMKPSEALTNNLAEVRRILERSGMRNARLFGSAVRGEDRGSDLDILVEAPPGTSLYDLADIEIELEKLLGCKVEVMTKGFLSPDVAKRIEAELVPLP